MTWVSIFKSFEFITNYKNFFVQTSLRSEFRWIFIGVVPYPKTLIESNYMTQLQIQQRPYRVILRKKLNDANVGSLALVFYPFKKDQAILIVRLLATKKWIIIQSTPHCCLNNLDLKKWEFLLSPQTLTYLIQKCRLNICFIFLSRNNLIVRL